MFAVSRALPRPVPRARAGTGAWGVHLSREMVPAYNPPTRSREVALGFHMGNNKLCRDEERKGICSLLPGEAVPQGHGGGLATGEGVQGRMLSPALPRQTEGCRLPEPSSV